MKEQHQLTPVQWLAYWQTLTEREVKAAMKYIRRHADDKGALQTLMATLPKAQQQIIQRGLDLTEHSTRLLLLAELGRAFDSALDDADTGVELGDKPRIVK